MNDPIGNSDEGGGLPSGIGGMIINFALGFIGGAVGLYLANVTLNVVMKKKNIFNKNDSWGTYVAEAIKSGVFSIFGGKYIVKLGAVLAASVIKQFVDMILYKVTFSWYSLLRDVLIGVFIVTLIHFGPTVLGKLSRKQKKNSSKLLAKVKELIRKIVDHIINKLKKVIEKLVSFFKNTFVKRFSISYAKRIGLELMKIFT